MEESNIDPVKDRESFKKPIKKTNKLLFLVPILIIAVLTVVVLLFLTSSSLINKNTSVSVTPTPLTSKVSSKSVLIVNRPSVSSTGLVTNSYQLIDETGEVIKTLIPPGELGASNAIFLSNNHQLVAYNSLEQKQCEGTLCIPISFGIRVRNLGNGIEQSILTPLKTTEGSVSNPFFSPNSSTIAYYTNTPPASNNLTTYSFYLYDIAKDTNSKIATLSNVPYSSYGNKISWLPDNSGFYFSDGSEIYLVFPSNKTVTKVGPGGYAQTTGDSDYLIVLKNNNPTSTAIEVKNLVSNETSLVSENASYGGLLGGQNAFVYSVYTPTNPGQQNILPSDKTDIYMYNIDTKESKLLVSGSALVYVISPDGKKLAYQEATSGNPSYEVIDIPTLKKATFLPSLTQGLGSNSATPTIVNWY